MFKVKKIMIENAYVRYLIVWSEEGSILNFYPYINKIINVNRGKFRKKSYSGKEIYYDCVAFLNFCIVEKGYTMQNIESQITFFDAQDFLNVYVNTMSLQTGDVPNNCARLRMRRSITHFLVNLKDSGKNSDIMEHFIVRESENRGQRQKKEFELNLYKSGSLPEREVLRECPKFFVDSLFYFSSIFAPEVWILLCFQRYAGLRPSEACNVRMEDSCYGPGIERIYDENNRVIRMVIDLRKEETERKVRDDNVYTGRIKKPRLVNVHLKNACVLSDAYEKYAYLTREYKRHESRPLVVSQRKKNGVNQAYTYDSYRKAFKKIVQKYVIPDLVGQGGEQQIYAMKLLERPYGPHMLREYFTCWLNVEGASIMDMIHYRGDAYNNYSTAQMYLSKGGAVERIVDEIKEELPEAVIKATKR